MIEGAKNNTLLFLPYFIEYISGSVLNQSLAGK
jgi:hypothetical protein